MGLQVFGHFLGSTKSSMLQPLLYNYFIIVIDRLEICCGGNATGGGESPFRSI